MVRSDAQRRVSNHEAAEEPPLVLAADPSRRLSSLRDDRLLRMRRSKLKTETRGTTSPLLVVRVYKGFDLTFTCA
jgi:hypothetical protein